MINNKLLNIFRKRIASENWQAENVSAETKKKMVYKQFVELFVEANYYRSDRAHILSENWRMPVPSSSSVGPIIKSNN